MNEGGGAPVTCARVRDGNATVGAHMLAAQWRYPHDTAACPVLALHGARSDLHRWRALLEPLQALGVGSLAPSLSGHGPQSPIPVERTSLAQNLREALHFAELAGADLRMVLGSSMGGALALRVAEAVNARRTDQIQVLALCGPALYPEAAWSAPRFGTPFREAISTPFGFLESRSLAFLRRFQGRVLLIQGQWDGLQATDHGAPAGRSAGEVSIRLPEGHMRSVWSPIPAEVFDALREAAGARLQHIVLEGADHRVGAFLQHHPAVALRLAELLHGALQHSCAPAAPAASLRISPQGEVLSI